MKNLIKIITGDKKEYREQAARAQALPDDYRFVFEKSQAYLWRFAGGTGHDMLKTQADLLELLEAGAASGRHVLDVTGGDVASFCDELMRGNRLWTDAARVRLNRKLHSRLKRDSRT